MRAAAANGIDASEARLIRNGSHVMWAMPGGIVGRVGERGSKDASAREVAISRWLDSAGIRAVRALDGPMQPTVVEDFTVTWWELLPEHRPASPAELGSVLRRLHNVTERPSVALPTFSAFGSTRRRLQGLHEFDLEVAWLTERMDCLERQYLELAGDMRSGPIHGDAWQGNAAVLDNEHTVILDLEAFCVGPIYWDLIPVAVDYTDFSRITVREYEEFADAYGFDVTATVEYRTLADIQETRWTAYVLGKATRDSAEGVEAKHRIACLMGDIPRPWKWKAF